MKKSKNGETETTQGQQPSRPDHVSTGGMRKRRRPSSEQAILKPTDSLHPDNPRRQRQDHSDHAQIDLVDESGAYSGGETVPQEEISEGHPIPRPVIRGRRNSRAVREISRKSFNEIKNLDPFERGEFFIEWLDENYELIADMPLLEAHTTITILGNRFRFTYEQLADALRKYQFVYKKVLPIYQILIILYETAVDVIDETDEVKASRVELELTKLFSTVPQLRSRALKLQIIEMAREIFSLSGREVGKLKRKRKFR